MKILAVDTSSKNCSVAILEVNNDKFNVLICENSDDEKTHSQKLMPMIDGILKKTNLSLDDINLLACCVGPGSFTGIRIGIASVKAFADVKNIPTVAVTSLESLSYNVQNASYVVSLLDCKNENVYGAMFYKMKQNYAIMGENVSDNINLVLDKFLSTLYNVKTPDVTFVGDGSILYKDLITSKFAKNTNLQNCTLHFETDNLQSAISLGKCAYYKFLQGHFGDSNNLSPLYLRKPQAERGAIRTRSQWPRKERIWK